MALTKATVAAGASENAAGPAGMSRGNGTWGGWHPSIVYLLLLVIGEAIIVGFLSRHLLK